MSVLKSLWEKSWKDVTGISITQLPDGDNGVGVCVCGGGPLPRKDSAGVVLQPGWQGKSFKQ